MTVIFWLIDQIIHVVVLFFYISFFFSSLSSCSFNLFNILCDFHCLLCKSYGPAGVCIYTVKGLGHVIWGNPKCSANMMPVDYCINAILCAAWDVHHRYQEALNESYEVPIYNHLYAENNLTWSKYMKNARLGLHKPLEKTLW